MNTNLKSGNAVVRLLLAHGEKLGIVAIGICAALIVWSAIGRERIERTPAELQTLAKNTNSHLAGFTWDRLDEIDKKLAEPVPEAAMAKLSADDFPVYAESFNPPVLIRYLFVPTRYCWHLRTWR